MKRILVLNAHPDAQAGHFDAALADAYADGAAEAGHEVRRLTLATLDFPLLRSKSEWESGDTPAAIAQAQAQIAWADHLVLVYPLWLGTMPALLKAFLEQALRPGFAFEVENGAFAGRKLAGKSARVVVTMGMPALFYRLYYRAHSLKSLERNILRFCGIKPVRHSLIGMVEGSDAHRQRALKQLRAHGRAAR